MSHSLGAKLSRLRHKGYITDIEYQRLKKALEQEPCEDAISRREAIKMFTYNYKGERIPNYDCDNFPVQIAMKTVKKMLRELPPVKPQEPKTGHWIEKDYLRRGIVYSCSKCGSFVHEKTNFCPDCGANMSENPIDSKVI